MQKLVRSIVGAAALLGGAAAHAQQGSFLYFLYGTNKSFMQTGPFVQTFQNGNFTALLRDGIYIYEPCALNGSPNPFAPGQANCGIGSTAFVASGDLNLDGIRDDLSYYQVTSIVTNRLIKPFLPEKAVLRSVPAKSEMYRLVGKNGFRGFVDDSVITFYNLLVGDLFEYDQARYLMVRPYTNIAVMNREFNDGGYVFEFPRLDGATASFGGPMTPFVEQYESQSQGGLNTRFRYTNHGSRWDGEYMELDPRVINTFTWQGTTTGQVRSNDRLYFSVYDSDDIVPVFPPSGVRVRLPYVNQVSAAFPSYFFTVGDTGVARLEFERGGVDLRATNEEWASRTFKAKVRFIDSYEGYSGLAFPVGTSLAQRAPGYDYDNDGFSNLLEFAYQSDPTGNSLVVKPTPIAPGPVTFQVDPVLVNAVRTVTITKRVGVGKGLIYGFEISTNGGTSFTKITGTSHAGWTLVEPESAGFLKLKSTGNIPASAIIRPYVEQKLGY